jgi:hypothetical protein
MIKILLTLALAFAFIGANAQCTPDPQYPNTIAGVFPDTIVGLADGFVGQSYSQNLTIITPNDTVVDVLGSLVPVTIDSINFTGAIGLPPNFAYTCDPPTCSFPGGSITCAELYSTTNPTAADIGIYPITLNTTAYASDVPFIGTMTQDDVTAGYYIEISAATSIFNQFNNTTFELKEVYPNPVNNNAKIQFISGSSADIIFTVFNHLGKKIEERNIAATRGVNDIEISANDYDNGMYLYSLNNGIQIVSKRMIVAN